MGNTLLCLLQDRWQYGFFHCIYIYIYTPILCIVMCHEWHKALYMHNSRNRLNLIVRISGDNKGIFFHYFLLVGWSATTDQLSTHRSLTWAEVKTSPSKNNHYLIWLFIDNHVVQLVTMSVCATFRQPRMILMTSQICGFFPLPA